MNRMIIIYIVILMDFIILKNSNSYIYRPVEIECFENIERENKLKRIYGINPEFTKLEKKIYIIDLYLKEIVIPEMIKKNKLKNDGINRIPIALYELSDITGHSSQYIQKVLDNIDNKIFLREHFRLNPVLPTISKIDIKEIKDSKIIETMYKRK